MNRAAAIAGLLPWVDWLFGTMHLPKRFRGKYGSNDPMPDGYLGQLVQPFRPRR